ncbi:MAG: hypothetical protein JWM11_7807 [Planctomycetaceae bacterium]|nr:hypothetical protein [Planctomycetaceae bacterium]
MHRFGLQFSLRPPYRVRSPWPLSSNRHGPNLWAPRGLRRPGFFAAGFVRIREGLGYYVRNLTIPATWKRAPKILHGVAPSSIHFNINGKNRPGAARRLQTAHERHHCGDFIDVSEVVQCRAAFCGTAQWPGTGTVRGQSRRDCVATATQTASNAPHLPGKLYQADAPTTRLPSCIWDYRRYVSTLHTKCRGIRKS